MRWAPTVLALLAAGGARADLPLSLEDLLSDKGQFRIGASLLYANSSATRPVTLTTTDGATLTVPVVTGTTLTNSDHLFFTLSMRYGATSNLELYLHARQLRFERRRTTPAGRFTDKGEQFVDLVLGASYGLGDNFLGFVEYTADANSTSDMMVNKRASLGVTAYATYDPIVVSLTAIYSQSEADAINGQRYEPGPAWSLSPSVAFAANDRFTLSYGFQWLRRGEQSLGETRGNASTATSLILGLGYGPSRKDTLNLRLVSDISSGGGANLSLSWLHKF